MHAASLPLGDGIPAFSLSVLIFEPAQPTQAGVVVTHGHFGGGKGDPTAQQIAWRLARRGARVVIVDSPGVEEWAVAGRQIHGPAGAHNRAWLAAAGTSALALQVAGVHRAIDLLSARGASRIGLTGASGGAVQAFYAGVSDPRVQAVAMASVPPIPREQRAGGCPCDQLPGMPGPDPEVLASLEIAGLWMAEVEQPRPEGLGPSVRFEVVLGSHGYDPAMQQQALAFFDQQLPLRSVPWQDAVPQVDLRTPGSGANPALSIRDLPVRPTASWQPEPDPQAPYEVDCRGTGPVVLVAGGEARDLAALAAVGLSTCALTVPPDATALADAIGGGKAAADRPAGATRRAVQRRGAVAVYAVRAWALPASTAGVPFVVRDPVSTLAALDPEHDPPWVHVPGAWWGAIDRALAPALLTSDDPELLATTLAHAVLPAALLPAALPPAAPGPTDPAPTP